MGDKGSKLSKNSRDYSFMSSIPTGELKHKDPGAIFNKLVLPDKYKQVMGPNALEMAKYNKKRNEKLVKMKIMLKARMAQQEQVYRRQKDEDAENLKLPTDIYQDADGRIRDKEGNIINLNKMQVSTLNINKNKFRESRIKELLKYQRAFKPESVRDNFNYDSSLKTVSKSRESRINAAFHFIEKGSIVGQKDCLEDPKFDENGDIIKPIPAGVKRVGLKVKHHDPIPDFEWWDQQFIEKKDNNQPGSNYLSSTLLTPIQDKFIDWDQSTQESDFLTAAKIANPDAMDLELTDDDRKKILLERESKVQGLQENTDYFYELLRRVKSQVFNDKFLYEIVKEKD